MSHYIEFPVDLLMGVHWNKKPGDGGGGGGPDEPGPCGALTWNDQVMGGVGMWSPQAGGLFFLAASPDQIVVYVPAYGIVGDNFDSSKMNYLWSNPTLFVVSASTLPYADAGFTVDLPFAIKVWRNQDPRSFNPCTATPIIDQPGGPGAELISVHVEPQNGGESYPPIFMVTGQGAAHCKKVGIPTQVQAKCPDETDGTLPPQPDGYPAPSQGRVLGPALPGSIFLTGYL